MSEEHSSESKRLEESSESESLEESSEIGSLEESSESEANDGCCHCESEYDVLFTCVSCKPSGPFCPKCRSTYHDRWECKVVFNDKDNERPDSVHAKPITIQLQKTYRFAEESREHNIGTICPIDEYTFWAYDQKKTPSILFITLGEDIQYKEVFRSDHIFEISYSKCGFLYLTVKKEIIRIDLKGKVEKFVDCTPLACCGIYAYDSGDIVVGLIENEFDATPVHQIEKYNKSGEQIEKFEYNIEDTPNFIDAIPQFITVNSVNGDILILDWNGEVQNRIVALTPKGDVHWIFHGIFNQPNDDFFPNGLCFTETGNMIIIESKRLIVLSLGGSVDTTSSLSNKGIENVSFITRLSGETFFMINNKSNIQKLSISGL